jgi:uncharacterized protein (DUF2236 family)
MSIALRINAERVVLAGWSRAILLQLAHPLVAQGVADHSSFSQQQRNADRPTPNAEGNAERRTPSSGGTLFSAAVRLHHTVQAMRHLTFGDDPQRRAALEGIRAIHRRVNGTLVDAVGPYPAGTRYSAEDAPLVLWVHATLMDSLPLVYSAVVAPLSEDDRDAWCHESAPVARALGAGGDVPETWAALQTYMASMLSSGTIEVSRTARHLADDVLAPRYSSLVSPLRAMNRAVTVGLLPPTVRTQYGFSWHARDDARLQRALWLLRAVRRVTPDAIAHWPDARAPR